MHGRSLLRETLAVSLLREYHFLAISLLRETLVAYADPGRSLAVRMRRPNSVPSGHVLVDRDVGAHPEKACAGELLDNRHVGADPEKACTVPQIVIAFNR